MRKLLFLSFITICSALPIFAEDQYLLQCNINTESVSTVDNSVLSRSTIERFFIVDNILASVYDANNLPLDVEQFTEESIVFRFKTMNFNTAVNTRITYDPLSKKIRLEEMYTNSAYSSNAKFVTKGEGNCKVTPIERKPIF